MTSSPRRFRVLRIEELFGPGTSVIEIPFRVDQRVTVLHGRNGSGKTITLGLLKALREGQYGELRRYPFRRIRVEMVDGSWLSIEQQVPGGGPSSRGGKRVDVGDAITLRFSFCEPGAEVVDGELAELRSSGDRRAIEVIAAMRAVDALHSSRVDRKDPRTGHQAAAVDHFDHLEAEQLEAIRGGMTRWYAFMPRSVEPPELRAFRESLPPVKLIRTDRLYLRPDETSRDPDPPRPRLMVEHLSQQIRTLVQQADQQYRITSTRLDSSLPQRLFQPPSEVLSLDNLRARSAGQRTQEARLQALGLLKGPPEAIDEAKLDDTQRGAFQVILSDREEKLRPFTDVVNKAERLLESLNRKLAPKKVKLDLESGYQVLTATDRELPLESLSSGEQHELVLLHELLFDVASGSMILIDEPELSLHVTWQEDVLPDLMEIARLSDLDFVLATHSPYIIGDHDELMVRLGEPV